MFRLRHILIWSKSPDELMKFYRDVLELELTAKQDIPDDYGYVFDLGDSCAGLWIGRHSEVDGKSKEPIRIMHDLQTDEVQKWFDKVKSSGCEIIAEPFISPDSPKDEPKYVCTFLDPEGNCWQFVGKLK